jgi:hypothetical protein
VALECGEPRNGRRERRTVLGLVGEARRAPVEEHALGGVEELRDVAVAVGRVVAGCGLTRRRWPLADRVQAVVDLADHRRARRADGDDAENRGEHHEQRHDCERQPCLDRHR